MMDKVDIVDKSLKVKKNNFSSSSTISWLEKYRNTARPETISTLSTKRELVPATAPRPRQVKPAPVVCHDTDINANPIALRRDPPTMTLEDEESLFDRLTASTMPKPDVDWLWARGDLYAASRPSWTFRQCQLAACVDYEEARP